MRSETAGVEANVPTPSPSEPKFGKPRHRSEMVRRSSELIGLGLHECNTIAEYVSYSIYLLYLIESNRHFKKILDGLTLSGFYGRHVHLPTSSSPTPTEIYTNLKWFPWFRNVLGAIDGTHLPCCPPAAELHTARDRKGKITQNCLAAVSFSMRFLFFVSGWDGCASDSTM